MNIAVSARTRQFIPIPLPAAGMDVTHAGGRIKRAFPMRFLHANGYLARKRFSDISVTISNTVPTRLMTR
jgi:hypothetical protein